MSPSSSGLLKQGLRSSTHKGKRLFSRGATTVLQHLIDALSAGQAQLLSQVVDAHQEAGRQHDVLLNKVDETQAGTRRVLAVLTVVERLVERGAQLAEERIREVTQNLALGRDQAKALQGETHDRIGELRKELVGQYDSLSEATAYIGRNLRALRADTESITMTMATLAESVVELQKTVSLLRDVGSARNIERLVARHDERAEAEAHPALLAVRAP